MTSAGQCPLRCGSRVDIAEWMADAGGTPTFHDIALELAVPDSLPRFVPQVGISQIGELDRGLSWPAYAVLVATSVSPASHRIVPAFRSRTAAEALGLGGGPARRPGRLWHRPLGEAFWTRRKELFGQLA